MITRFIQSIAVTVMCLQVTPLIAASRAPSPHQEWHTLVQNATLQMRGGRRLSADQIKRLEKAFKQHPAEAEIQLVLARAHYHKGAWTVARSYAEMAAGQFGEPDRDAESYYFLGKVLSAMGLKREAETALLAALEKQPGNTVVMKDLWASYRHDPQKYVDAIVAEIQKDPANDAIFNAYLEYRQGIGTSQVDQKIEQRLLKLKLKRPEEIGPLYFNLGEIAARDGRLKEAKKRFQQSLKAYQKCSPSPAERMVALRAWIADLERGSKTP